MKTSTIINIAVLGVANIAIRSLIPSIRSLPELYRLSALASRNFSKVKPHADSFDCKAYDSYENLLADLSIDAVYIPLPNALHYPYVKMALEQGKHVLVEKSLGCSLSEVQELVEIAHKKNLALVENFQFRFHSQLQTILQLVKNGELGDLRAVRVAFGFPPFPDEENIRYKPELGGGALLDAGAYAMKIAPFFLGNELSVVQGAMAIDSAKNVDIWGGGILKQKNGALFCQFAYGFDNFYQCVLELWGSKGKLSTNRIFTAPPNIEPRITIETNDGVQERVLQADNHYINMLKHFYNLVVNGGDKSSEYKENIRQASLIHQFKKVASKT